MSEYQVRPLGYREQRAAFEVVRGPLPAPAPGGDIRQQWTLWDPQGRPHVPYPELQIAHAMSGREVMALQSEQWAQHRAATLRLFGAAPLSGTLPPAALRGVLSFPVGIWSERGRWTLSYQERTHWYFTPAQIRDGLPRPLPPAR